MQQYFVVIVYITTFELLKQTNMATTYTDSQIITAIETLLKNTGHKSTHVVSVVHESSKYCYKTFDGTIGTVRKDFLHDRI